MTTTPTAIPAEAAPTVTALQPASTGRRVVAWLIDIVIVAALVGVVFLLGLIKINGCDTWDPATQQFGGSCPFESTREVTQSDGSVDLVYVLDSGRELPADHPTVKTVFLGTRIVDPPSAATYLVGLGYVLVVYVVVQGLLGWTPGKLLAGVRLARDDGRRPGIPASFVRWLVIDGFIGLFGVVMGLIDAWWPLRLLAADAALLLVGGLVALVAGGRQPGDRVAGTLVVDEAALALRRASTKAAEPAPVDPDATPTGPATWAPAGPAAPSAAEAAATGAAVAGAVSAAGHAGTQEQPATEVPGPAGEAPAPTPLPQWPASPPVEAAPASGGPAPAQPAVTPAAAVATPLGASVGAAPSALRPIPAAAPAGAAAGGGGEATPVTTGEPQSPAEPAAAATAAPESEESADVAATDVADTGAQPPEEAEPDALVTTSVPPSGASAATAEATGQTADAEAAPPGRQPEWDEARRAYIFWDDSRQEWLQYFDESQSWGPITRA